MVLAFFRRFAAVGAFLGRSFGFRDLHIVSEPGNGRVFELKQYPAFSVVRAHWSGRELVNLSEEVRDSTKYFLFHDVAVSANRRGGFLRSRRSIVVPDNGLPGVPKLFFSGTEVASIKAQNGKRVLVSGFRAEEFFDEGIFAGSMAPHNWFHWLIDNLPNLLQASYLPSNYSSFPLLVPQAVKSRPNWMTALELVAGHREVVFLPSDSWVHVRQLVKIEGITRPNPRPLTSGVLARVGILSAPILEFRDHILLSLGLADVEVVKGRRFFVGRRSSRARNYNQDEVFSAAAVYGFELVFLEDMSFADSVRVFREAEVIVGPHDAGWANMLFSTPETKALLWTWQGGEEDNWYANLAYLSRVRYLQLTFHTLGSIAVDNRDADYYLDPVVFERRLEELLG